MQQNEVVTRFKLLQYVHSCNDIEVESFEIIEIQIIPCLMLIALVIVINELSEN